MAGVGLMSIDADDLDNVCGKGKQSLLNTIGAVITNLQRKPRQLIVTSLEQDLLATAQNFVPVTSAQGLHVSPFRQVILWIVYFLITLLSFSIGLSASWTVRVESKASERTPRQSLSAHVRATTATQKTAPASIAVSSSTNMRMTTPSLSTAARTVWYSTTATKCASIPHKPPPVMDHPKYFRYHAMNTSVPAKDSSLILKTVDGSMHAGTTTAMAPSLTTNSDVPSDWPSTRQTFVATGPGTFPAATTTVETTSSLPNFPRGRRLPRTSILGQAMSLPSHRCQPSRALSRRELPCPTLAVSQTPPSPIWNSNSVQGWARL